MKKQSKNAIDLLRKHSIAYEPSSDLTPGSRVTVKREPNPTIADLLEVLEDAKDRFEILEDASEATAADSAVLDRIRAVLARVR